MTTGSNEHLLDCIRELFNLSVIDTGCDVIAFVIAFLGSLTIRHSQESDEGKYECVAENSVGVAYSYGANLYVRGQILVHIKL